MAQPERHRCGLDRMCSLDPAFCAPQSGSQLKVATIPPAQRLIVTLPDATAGTDHRTVQTVLDGKHRARSATTGPLPLLITPTA